MGSIPSDGGEMANRISCWLACAAIAMLLSGCVERRFLVETTPPGAMVYVNNKQVGPSPVDVPFTYYGTYLISLELDGHQTQIVQQKVSAPFYEYPPLDFLAENIYPFKLSDVQRFHFDLVPLARPNLDELRLRAEELREQGRNLPPPTRPYEPNKRPPAAASPIDPRRGPTTPMETLPPPVSPVP